MPTIARIRVRVLKRLMRRRLGVVAVRPALGCDALGRRGSSSLRATRIAKISSNDEPVLAGRLDLAAGGLIRVDDVRQGRAGVVDDDPQVARPVLA